MFQHVSITGASQGAVGIGDILGAVRLPKKWPKMRCCAPKVRQRCALRQRSAQGAERDSMYTQLSENLTQIRNQLIQAQGDVARITAERDDLVQRTTAEMNDLKNALAEAKQRTYVVKPGDCPRSVNPSQSTHNQQRNSSVALF